MRKEVTFVCYPCKFTDGWYTIFQFYEDGIWDEDKLIIEEAIRNYPPSHYNWIKIEDSLDE